ncbi:MAG TPA: imelysin family protein [Desertimonas sp.]|nr:imelysin family protein [Desertimonas sp.]
MSVAIVTGIAVTVPAVAAAGPSDDDAQAVVDHYADGVHAAYSASLESATALDTAVDAFLADPTDETLEAAKQAWLAARDDYGLTEAFRFYGGPIDNETDGPEGLINAWPLDEAYIDYVEGDDAAGVVNDPDTYPTIDAELLTSLNEEGGEANISTGWHAIEFLLWGQDLSTDGPGARPVADYTTADNADRRATYLAVTSDLLLEHLAGLVDAWAPDAENYRAQFVAGDPTEALTMILTGIGELTRGELAGERMYVAYEQRSQEDEHSCFSDNTTADLLANARGIDMVLTGLYPGGVEGPGLQSLFEAADPDSAAALRESVDASIADLEAIPAPFDQHLVDGVPDDDPGRASVLAGIEALEAQADRIVAAADTLGVTIEV